MERRSFLKLLGLAGGAAAVGPGGIAVAAGEAEPARDSDSARALRELLALLAEVERRYLGPEWKVEEPADVAAGYRFLMHVLEGGLLLHLEADAERPSFTRIVSPTRKFLGDNPDAVYFSAPVRPDRSYRIRGNRAGAVYVSFSVESGTADGGYPLRVSSALNDTQFEVAPDGSFELVASAQRQPGSWLELAPDAGSVTTRHYFELPRSAAADPGLAIPISIEPLEPPGPPPPPDDRAIAAGIRRVANFVRGVTLDQPPPDPSRLPAWVSAAPNEFPQPGKPAGMGFAAVDNAYAMAPYRIGPDEALVIEGHFPTCRFANVVLWNRFLQSYDYAHRRVSLNREQTQLEPDGSFRMVVAHRDPGVANWLDTAGRPGGAIYWRFLLPEGEIERPRARLVPLAEVRR